MILTDMGRILSKEPLETGKSEFSFVLQTIDLDREFAGRGENLTEQIVEKSDSTVFKTTTVVLGIFISLMLLGGLFLFLRVKK